MLSSPANRLSMQNSTQDEFVLSSDSSERSAVVDNDETGKEDAYCMKRAASEPIMSSSGGNKRVRIAETPEVHPEATRAMSDREKTESWWTQSEYAAAKDSVKRLCRSHRQARRYSDCLSDAYETACYMAFDPELESSQEQPRNATTNLRLTLLEETRPEAQPEEPNIPPPEAGMICATRS